MKIKKIIKRIFCNFQLLLVIIMYKFEKKKKKKIIIGVTEVANILYNVKKIFNDDCIVVCKNRNKTYKKNKYDVDISSWKPFIKKLLLSAFLFGKLAKNAHFFIYLWNDGFLLEREYEFNFLKKNNIPIVCLFLGSEIRSRKLLLDYCKKINFNSYIEYDRAEYFLSDIHEKFCLELAEQADKYAKIVFSHPVDQMSYLKSKQWYFPVTIDENLFSFNENKFSVLPIRIVHAPSVPFAKGTPLVRSVIKMLKSEGYNFQYIELINVPNEVVVNELKNSHIVLNQFYAFIPGVFGHEAMATGNAVLMSAKSDCFPYKFNNAWLETEDWQLYYNLKFLLDQPEKIVEYAKNGYEYMSANLTIDKTRKYLLNVFKENGFIF